MGDNEHRESGTYAIFPHNRNLHDSTALSCESGLANRNR